MPNSDFPNKPLLGKSKEELYHQRNAEFQRANKIIESPDIRPQHSRAGTALYIKNKVKGKGGSNVERLYIAEIFWKYIECKPYNADGTPNLTADSIYVAKQTNAIGDQPNPPTLTARVAANQKTITLTNPATTLVQTLTPGYTVGESIYAAMGVKGNTTALLPHPILVGVTRPIENLELNVREWVDRLQVVCVSVNGRNYRMHVRGSGYAE